MILKNEVVPVLTQFLGAFATLFGIVMVYLSFIIRKTAMMTENETDHLPR
jgi:hypothetical protein